MSWGSLRLRLVAGGIVAILVALTIAGAGLTLLFERHVTRTIADDLDIHLKQLLAGIDIDPQGKLLMSHPPADPRIEDPLSGLYWQVSDDRGQLLRSRSLWDTTLVLPADALPASEKHQHEVSGPAKAHLLVAERGVIGACRCELPSLPISRGCRLPLRVSPRTFSSRLAFSASCWQSPLQIQVRLGLRPLDALRRGIAEIRSGRRQHLPANVPAEVRPLVEEVNALLDVQE